MEKIYINLSEPLSGKGSSKKALKIFGYLIIPTALGGIVVGIINADYGYSFFSMIGYLLLGLAYIFQSRNSYQGNNFVSVDSGKLEFKLGMTLKRKEIPWKDIRKISINLTSVTIDYTGGIEIIKTDWMLYKDVKEFKSAIRNHCRENGIVLFDN